MKESVICQLSSTMWRLHYVTKGIWIPQATFHGLNQAALFQLLGPYFNSRSATSAKWQTGIRGTRWGSEMPDQCKVQDTFSTVISTTVFPLLHLNEPPICLCRPSYLCTALSLQGTKLPHSEFQVQENTKRSSCWSLCRQHREPLMLKNIILHTETKLVLLSSS